MLQTAAVLPVQRADTFFLNLHWGGRGEREGSILHVMPPLESIPGDATGILVDIHHQNTWEDIQCI
jgi:hypothetical protein